MNRLVQGDVGSGKTVVAALAACQAIDAGYQAALMAPTEILAEQHFKKIISWLEPFGVRVVWLSGKQKAKEKREAWRQSKTVPNWWSELMQSFSRTLNSRLWGSPSSMSSTVSAWIRD